MNPTIVVVGSLNMDLVVHAPRHPKPGETLLGQWFATFPGGKGANQAAAAGRLGASVRMVGKVGQDAFGQELRAELQAAGVDTSCVTIDPSAPTGVALITVDDAGQNTIVVAAGSNGRLSPEDLQPAAPAFDGAGLLVMQLETPLETVTAAAQMAAARGMCVILNPAPAAPLPPELLRLVDYLTPNQHELALLAGTPAVEEGARVLLQAGAKNVIVTLGSEGVYYAGEQGTFRCPAFSVTVVDTTAAGDAFMGGFVCALAAGAPLNEAVRWGAAAGALAVTRAGAQSSLPDRAQVAALLAGQAVSTA